MPLTKAEFPVTIDPKNNHSIGESGMKFMRLSLLMLTCGIAILVVSSCSKEKEEKREKAKIEQTERITPGKVVFTSNCSSCHGETGNGDGLAAKTLELSLNQLDLSDSNNLSKIPNESLINVINNGGIADGKSALMPPFGSILSKDDVLNVVAYIRTDLCKCEYKE